MASSIIENDGIFSGSVSWNYTIPGGNSDHTNLKTLIDAAMPSGATFVASQGFATNSGWVVPTSVRYHNSDYSLQIRNFSSSEISASMTVYFAYRL